MLIDQIKLDIEEAITQRRRDSLNMSTGRVRVKSMFRKPALSSKKSIEKMFAADKFKEGDRIYVSIKPDEGLKYLSKRRERKESQQRKKEKSVVDPSYNVNKNVQSGDLSSPPEPLLLNEEGGETSLNYDTKKRSRKLVQTKYEIHAEIKKKKQEPKESEGEVPIGGKYADSSPYLPIKKRQIKGNTNSLNFPTENEMNFQSKSFTTKKVSVESRSREDDSENCSSLDRLKKLENSITTFSSLLEFNAQFIVEHEQFDELRILHALLEDMFRSSATSTATIVTNIKDRYLQEAMAARNPFVKLTELMKEDLPRLFSCSLPHVRPNIKEQYEKEISQDVTAVLKADKRFEGFCPPPLNKKATPTPKTSYT